METIKMDKRLALRLLNDGFCKVKLKGWGSVFTTGKNIVLLTGIDSVQMVAIRELQDELWNIKQITHIEYTDRFGCKSFMEVDW